MKEHPTSRPVVPLAGGRAAGTGHDHRLQAGTGLNPTWRTPARKCGWRFTSAPPAAPAGGVRHISRNSAINSVTLVSFSKSQHRAENLIGLALPVLRLGDAQELRFHLRVGHRVARVPRAGTPLPSPACARSERRKCDAVGMPVGYRGSSVRPSCRTFTLPVNAPISGS